MALNITSIGNTAANPIILLIFNNTMHKGLRSLLRLRKNAIHAQIVTNVARIGRAVNLGDKNLNRSLFSKISDSTLCTRSSR